MNVPGARTDGLLTRGFDCIKQIAELARRDGQLHDISLGISSAKNGFTAHCNSAPVPVAETRLRTHCERRKYTERAKTWFSICIEPIDESLRFALNLDYEWHADSRLEELTARAPRGGTLAQALRQSGNGEKSDVMIHVLAAADASTRNRMNPQASRRSWSSTYGVRHARGGKTARCSSFDPLKAARSSKL